VRKKKFESQLSFIRCPGCMSAWGSLLELRRSGGRVYSVGLKLVGACHECGYTWGISRDWRCVEVVLDANNNSKRKAHNTRKSKKSRVARAATAARICPGTLKNVLTRVRMMTVHRHLSKQINIWKRSGQRCKFWKVRREH
jgi:hypothetical protein